MEKICPISMAGEPTYCFKEECNSYINGDCFLNNMSLSYYFLSKNLQGIQQDIGAIAYDIERMRARNDA